MPRTATLRLMMASALALMTGCAIAQEAPNFKAASAALKAAHEKAAVTTAATAVERAVKKYPPELRETMARSIIARAKCVDDCLKYNEKFRGSLEFVISAYNHYSCPAVAGIKDYGRGHIDTIYKVWCGETDRNGDKINFRVERLTALPWLD